MTNQIKSSSLKTPPASPVIQRVYSTASAFGKISDLEDTLRRIRTRLSLYTPEELPEILVDIANALGEFDDVYDMNPTDLVKEARRYFLAAGIKHPCDYFNLEDDAGLRELVMESAKTLNEKALHVVLDAMINP